MRHTLPPLILLLASPLAAAAQMPGPPPQLERFEPFLGNWEGGGTFAPEPGAEMPWTARSTMQRVLGGFFVREDMEVDAGMGAPFVFRTVYAWDASREKYVFVTMSNMAGMHEGVAWFTADGHLTNTVTAAEDGVVATEHWSAIAKDGVTTTTAWRSENGGEFRRYLTGRMERGGEGFDALAADAVPIAPPHEALAALSGEAGNWSFQGKVEPMPGMPMMEVSGRERILPILGGHVQLSLIEGDPIPGAPDSFHGEVYAGWSTESNSLLYLNLDNFGGWTIEQAWAQGTDTILVGSGSMYGLPHVTRTVIRHDGGDVIRIKSERMASTMPAATAFEAEFQRIKDV